MTTLIGPHVRFTRDRIWFGIGIGWGTAFGARRNPIVDTLGLGASVRVGVELVRQRLGGLSASLKVSYTTFAPGAGPNPGPLPIVVGLSYELR